MGVSVEVRLSFSREKHTRWARHVAEDMIKLHYIPEDWPWRQDAEELGLGERYFKYGNLAEKIDLSGYSCRYCALSFLKKDKLRIDIERCADIQRTVSFSDPFDFFAQLCLTLALRFPTAPFRAQCRYEMTVSGAVQLTQVRYYGKVLHYRQISGMLPGDWGPWRFGEYVWNDGCMIPREPGNTDLWNQRKYPDDFGLSY